MTGISLVIITHNEERNIERCINAAAGIADEVIIVDSGSSDNTVIIAKKLGARCFHQDWLGYAQQKDFANSLASYDYILSLDADEVISDELRKVILAHKSSLQGAYELNRLTNYCGSWVKHSSWYPDWKVRLFPKNKARWNGAIVHEELLLDKNVQITRLQPVLFHFSYYDRHEHRMRADKYSRLTAQKMFASGKRANLLQPAISAAGRWLKMYVFRLGFLDGRAGLDIATISAKSNFYKYRELRRLHLLSLRKPLRHICISRTDSIGDVILTLPLAGVIKQAWPQAKITFIGKTYTESIIRGSRFIDNFLNADELLSLSPDQRMDLFNSSQFDAVIHVFPNKVMAKAAKAAGVPIRIGVAKRLAHWFYCNYRPWFSRKNSPLHEAQLNLKLLAPLNLQDAADITEIPAFYGFDPSFPCNAINLIDKEKFNLILHPKSRGSAVEWSLASYASLIKSLPQNQFKIFITGTSAEKEWMGNNSLPWNQPNVVDLTGKLNLQELMAFIAQSDALIAASTGPLHIAAASGIAALGLYSPKRPIHPGRWAPVGKKASVLVANSHPANAQGLEISVEDVVSRVLALAEGKRSK